MLPHPMQIFQWENYKRRVTGIKGDTWCGRDGAGRAGDRRPWLQSLEATGQLGANIALSTAMDSEALCPQPPVLTTTLRGRKNRLCSQCPPEVQGLAPGHRE